MWMKNNGDGDDGNGRVLVCTRTYNLCVWGPSSCRNDNLLWICYSIGTVYKQMRRSKVTSDEWKTLHISMSLVQECIAQLSNLRLEQVA